jgi:putative phage-type endonuclease
MEVIKVEQGSPEWFEARRGIPSASNFSCIITSTGTPSKSSLKYLYKLAGERVSGIIEEGYKNYNMERGTEMEAEAREAYEMITGNTVEEVGFCFKEGYGASPDGLVDEDGLLEIKCPTAAVHVGYVLAGVLPTDYFHQTQGQLLATGRKWVDFFSYYPGIKPLLVRVKRDEPFLKALEKELKIFCKKLDEVVTILKKD